MTNSDQEPLRTIGIDYAKVISSDAYSALVRETARTAIKDGYLIVGDWLKTLHDDDLNYLLLNGETAIRGQMPSGSFVMLAVILALGEGVGAPSDDAECSQFVRRLIMLSSAESLSRKGIAVFHRDKATLGSDVDNVTIMELKDFGTVKAAKPPEDVDQQFPKRKK